MTRYYKKRRLTINDFSKNQNCDDDEYSLPKNCPRLCYNLKSDRGALIQGIGIANLSMPIGRTSQLQTMERDITYDPTDAFLKLWQYNYYSEANGRYEYVLISLGYDMKLHFTSVFFGSSQISTLENFTFNQEPVALNFRINGKDVIGFVSPSDPFLVWYCDSDPYIVSTVPKFQSICYHNGRLFAIDNDKNYAVRYSSDLNPLDWTVRTSANGGGIIELNEFKGQLKNLLSLKEAVYVFRDFGISKIAGYVNNTVFSATNVYTSSCKIYCETACVCGSVIFFLAEDGLYKFDGYDAKKVDLKLLSLFEGTKQIRANTCFFDGKLYIACKLNYTDEEIVGTERTSTTINNALIEYDVATGSYTLMRGVDVMSMLGIKALRYSRLVLCLNNPYNTTLWMMTNTGNVCGKALKKSWQSGKIYLDTFDKDKILKEVNLISKYNCQLKITTEEGTKTLNVIGKKNMQRVRANVKGKTFSLEIASNSDKVYVASLQMVFNEQSD